jgi:hypothetical protein
VTWARTISAFKDENDNNQVETDQEKENMGSSRIQELNPFPIPTNQRDCVTLDQNTSMDDQ